MANPIITLTTDYGTNDHLVGTLKGVLLKINPELTIVDITHHVNAYDLLDGALTIGAAYSYFPARTIHMVVVDPGVGTERRPLLVTAQNQYFVAPDNGVLSLVYEREQDNLVVRHANAEHYFLQPISKTFHGRDIFAPVAAWLSKGWQTAAMGDEIEDYQRFVLPRAKEVNGGAQGVVLRIDTFGNVMTNFRAEDLAGVRTKWRWPELEGGHSHDFAAGGYVCDGRCRMNRSRTWGRAVIWRSASTKRTPRGNWRSVAGRRDRHEELAIPVSLALFISL